MTYPNYPTPICIMPAACCGLTPCLKPGGCVTDLLIELKVSGFSHEHLGQLNTYLNWFRAHEMVADDNPPVGILLCTEKNHALVEYALAGMDNHLFVSKYQLALPDKEEMRRFLEEQMAEELGGDAAENAEGV